MKNILKVLVLSAGATAFAVSASADTARNAEAPAKRNSQERAGVVKSVEDGMLKLAVAEGRRTGEISFVTNAATKWEGGKEDLVPGRQVFVHFVMHGGSRVALAVLSPESSSEREGASPAKE